MASAARRLVAPKRATTTDQAYEAILAGILNGAIGPGEQLVLQDLADELGTSLQPIREAIRRLDATGIIEVAPHRGARVRPLSDEDFDDTYRARLAIESILVEYAAEHFSAEDASAASAALERQRDAAERGDAAGASDAHEEFHFTVYRAARSPWLFRSMLPTWRNAERYRISGLVDRGAVAQRLVEHQAILDACVRHDAAAAREALRDHLLRTVRERSAGS